MKRAWFFLWLMVLAGLPHGFAIAAPLTDVTVGMSRQTVGAASDFDMRFTVADAVSNGGATLTFEFAGGFSLAALTAADIDLFHGATTGLETQEAVGASASTGVWGAAVAGNVLTLTPPTDAAVGEISVGEKVVVRIGTNAGGTHQITNPSTPGSYAVQFGGAFGGTATAQVPIVASISGGFAVSFSVVGPGVAPGGGGGGGGGGGAGGGGAVSVPAPAPVPVPPPEPEEPRVLHVLNANVFEVLDTSAQLSWDTDLSAATTIAVSGGGSVRTLAVSTGGFSHTVVLTGLRPGTAYSASVFATSGALSASSGPVIWTTREPVAMGNVLNFRAVRSVADAGSVRLDWTLPVEPLMDADRVVLVSRPDRYPAGLDDGREVYRGRGAAAEDAPGRGEVFYAAFVVRDGRRSSGALARLSPVPVPVPTPVRVPVPVPVPVPVAIPGADPVVPTGPSAVSPGAEGVSGPMGGSTTGAPGGSVAAGGSSVTGPGAGSGSVVGGVLPEVGPLIPTSPDAPLVDGAGGGASGGVEPGSAVPVPREGAVFSVSMEWRTRDGGLVLARGEESPAVLAGDTVQLVVAATQPIGSGQVEVDGSLYALGEAGGRYLAAFIPAEQAGAVEARLRIRSAGGKEAVLTRRISVVPPFLVLERAEADTPATDAEAEVFVRRAGKWSSVSGTRRAIGRDGAYVEYLPAGSYRIEIRKAGWNVARKEVLLAAAGPVQGSVLLEKTPQNPFDAIDPQAGVVENVGNVAEATAEAVAQAIEAVRTPEAQAAAQVVAPAVVVASVGVTTAAASSFNILNYLRFLLTQPLLLLRRRRREKWGQVYHSLTKQPVDLAIVRLLDAKTGAVRQTRITDAQGRYAFLAQAGEYRLEVVKPGYVFPSKLLGGESVDTDLVDLYHGENVAAQTSVTLTPNIPLDAIEKIETPSAVLHRQRFRLLQRGLSVLSLAVAGVSFVIQPTAAMATVAVLQVVGYFVFLRLAVPRKPKNWGIAYDQKTRKPLGRVAVRIFDKKYNKLLETQLTDRDGKYAFFAGKNVYYVTADHPGYERFRSADLDLLSESMGVVHAPLALQPKAAVAVPPISAT